MEHKIINALSSNQAVFKELLFGIEKEMYLWKPNPEKWCLLEIICHLNDIEREDFRTRTKQILKDPTIALPPVDPLGWVKNKNYIEQNYDEKLQSFLAERRKSVEWLHSLTKPLWNNSYNHPKLGSITAGMLLCNWLAHDYLHIRQITSVKYDFLKQWTGEDLSYAGKW